MKSLLLIIPLFFGCAMARSSTPVVKRLEFTESVPKASGPLVCVYIDRQARLYCMTQQEWNLLQEPADPDGIDTGSEDVTKILEKR